MDDSQAVRRGSRAEIVLIHYGDREPSQRSIPGRASAVDTCAYDEQVEHGVGKGGEIASH